MKEQLILQHRRTFLKWRWGEGIRKDGNTITDPDLLGLHLKKSSEWKPMACARRVKSLKLEGKVSQWEEREELKDQELWKQTGFHL